MTRQRAARTLLVENCGRQLVRRDDVEQIVDEARHGRVPRAASGRSARIKARSISIALVRSRAENGVLACGTDPPDTAVGRGVAHDGLVRYKILPHDHDRYRRRRSQPCRRVPPAGLPLPSTRSCAGCMSCYRNGILAMISLTDEQLRQVLELAGPIPVAQRDAFLRALAAELRTCGDVGPGELHRLCVEICHQIVPDDYTRRACQLDGAEAAVARRRPRAGPAQAACAFAELRRL